MADSSAIEDIGTSDQTEPPVDHPIAMAFGSLPSRMNVTTEELRRRFREEEALAEERRWNR